MVELYFLRNTTPDQMFGVLILTPTKTVVIDGGLEEDAHQLERLMGKVGRDCVDAWFFTHPHHDHIGTFLALYRKNPNILKGMIFCSFPSRQRLRLAPAHHDAERERWERMWDLLEGDLSSRFRPIREGDHFSFDELKIRILRVYDPNFEVPYNFVNNSSAVFRLDSPQKRVLILGDLGTHAGADLLKRISSSELVADYTQMAHHGQQGVDFSFYEAIHPKRCIWPTPEKIWFNDGGNGPGTGKWKTEQTRIWMKQLGAKEHYMTKDGIVKILI